MRCKSCGQTAYMGKACKSKKDPTKPKENHAHCPMCGWNDAPKEKAVRNLSMYEARKEQRQLRKEEKITLVETTGGKVQPEPEIISGGQ